jgi:hypothetical protein
MQRAAAMGALRHLQIGDRVRPAESSVADLGEVVNIRDDEYVIVQWYGSNKSTHHCQSLEIIGSENADSPSRFT